MEVVINKSYGGFGLSNKAYEELIKLGWEVTTLNKDKKYVNPDAFICKGDKGYFFVNECDDNLRSCPDLVKVVKKLGAKANGQYSDLGIVEIPDGVEWEINDYDGMEWVAEEHRRWG